MEMVNGYVFLDLTKTNVYAKALKVLGADKPVVIKEGSGSPYFVDSLTLDGTNVVITKGGKTITIANDNTITNEGLIANPTMENIVDLNGNKRFVDFENVDEEITGLDISYSKSSLSGTHLMVVLAGTIANGTTIAGNTRLTKINVPQWIKDKVYTTFASVIEAKSLNVYASDWTNQNWGIYFAKSSGDLYLITSASITTTADRTFRIQFDLLIDNE